MADLALRARRAFSRWALRLVLAQLAFMIGMTFVEALRKKRRASPRFPTAEPKSLTIADDEVAVYSYGQDLFEAMLCAIDSATDHVYFETYIWKDDDWGTRIKDALIRAAERGAEVYVIWDGFANLVVNPYFYSFPPGIYAMRHPVLTQLFVHRDWGRDHRKLLTVDGKIGFVGGYNIGSLYATGWRDTHARIIGPSVAELDNAFIDFWNIFRRPRRHPMIARNLKRSWFGTIRVQRNVPSMWVYPIRNMYLEAIDRAQHRIWLTHAYLIPDDDLVQALRQAVHRGVDVRVIVPERSNHVVADWLSRGHYTRLLRSGIRLFLYQDAMVHSKTATIDGAWSTIGTANLDALSLRGNYEVNLEVTDAALAHRLEELFELDLSNCYELQLDAWCRRSPLAKATEIFLRPWRHFF